MKNSPNIRYSMFSKLLEQFRTWWTTRCGGLDVLKLAIPMIISSGSWALMNFADRVFLTWHDPDIATGAALSAGILFFVLTAIPFGIGVQMNSFVSQYLGSGQPHRIGPAIWQGIFLALMVIPLYLLTEPLFSQIFYLSGHSEALIHAEKIYFRIAMYAAGGIVANEVLQAFFIGRGKTQAILSVNIFVLLVNIFLDYCWIFGKLGFPEWGIAGASAATSVSIWLKTFCFIGLMFLENGREDQFHILSGFKFDRGIFKRLIWFGVPGGLEFMLEYLGFAIFILMMGKLGENELAATSIAFSLNSLSFLPMIGIGLAVMSLVGNELGRNRPDLATRATVSALLIGGFCNLIFLALFLFFPGLLLYAYTLYSDPGQLESIREITIVILRFVALYLLFDGINLTLISALKGAGDTHFLLLASLVMAPILPLACWVGIGFFNFGVYGCWGLLTLWICIFASIFMFRFIGGVWKTKRVIETAPTKNSP